MADQQTMGAVDAPDIRIDVLKSVQRAGGVLSASGLTDALDRMADHARRVLTPGVVIAVVGAPGSGKSALVNGLIGSPLLMVDERFSTVVPTLVRDTRSPELAIRGRSDGRVETRAVPTEGMPSITTSLGNSGNRLDLFRVEVGTPNPILATGFTFIDMPAETLPARGSSRAAALAPLVDALIVAVPADRSITTAELGLVRRARDRGAHVVVAVTKLDSVGGKELRVEAVRSTLAADGLDVAVLGTSYSWRVLAMSRPGDPSIDAASGFPALIDHLDRSVRWRAQLVAASRSVAEGRSGVAQAQLLRAASAAAVRDPDVAEALGRGAGTLAELGRADAHWVRSLGDRFATLAVEAVGEVHAEIDRVAAMTRLPAARARVDEALAGGVEALGRRLFDVRSSVASELVTHVEHVTRLPIGPVLAPECIGVAEGDAWPAGAAWSTEGFRDPARRFFDLSGSIAGNGSTDVEMLVAASRAEVSRQMEAMALAAANGAATGIARRLSSFRSGLARARGEVGFDGISADGADVSADLAEVERRLLGLAGEGVPS